MSQPLVTLLPEPKQMTLYDGGHVPPMEVLMSASGAWLEAHPGPVVRQNGRDQSRDGLV